MREGCCNTPLGKVVPPTFTMSLEFVYFGAKVRIIIQTSKEI